MKDTFEYKNGQKIFRERTEDGVLFLEYPLFTETGLVRHGFSTRIGGVSEGACSEMNLSFTRGDREEAVKENFRRMGRAIGVKPEQMVFTMQTHTTNVKEANSEDAGNGYGRRIEYTDVDGLVTNEPGICLAAFYADCVPLFFLDPVKKAIGLSHSGWRGTVGKIGKITIDKMAALYGSDPKDILAAVGPSICQECYEVSGDVISAFRESYDESCWDELFYKKENGKYQLDLWKANEIVLKEAGITEAHTAVTNLCTCCNSSLLFSHRASHGKRGNLGAFLALEPEK